MTHVLRWAALVLAAIFATTAVAMPMTVNPGFHDRGTGLPVVKVMDYCKKGQTRNCIFGKIDQRTGKTVPINRARVARQQNYNADLAAGLLLGTMAAIAGQAGRRGGRGGRGGCVIYNTPNPTSGMCRGDPTGMTPW